MEDLDTIVLDYAQKTEKGNLRKFSEKLLHRPFAGPLLGALYGGTWPAIVEFYMRGGSGIYDALLPHESPQDNLVYYAFRRPWEFMAGVVATSFPSLKDSNTYIQIGILLTSWSIAGLAAQEVFSNLKKLKNKINNRELFHNLR